MQPSGSTTLYVAYAADASVHIPLAVSLCSLFENNPSQRIECLIMHDESFRGEAIENLQELGRKYGQRTRFLPFQTHSLADLPRTPYVTAPTFFRLLLPQRLEKEIRRVLYLDIDTLIDGDISALYFADLGGKIIGAVPDAKIGFGSHFIAHREYYGQLGVPHVKGGYFNAGMLLMDLQEWREADIGDCVLRLLATEPEKLQYSDQSALNAVLVDQWQRLPGRYNFQMHAYYAYSDCISGLEMEPGLRRDLEDASEHPVIYHFAGYPKPWENPAVFYGYKYLYYLRRSGMANHAKKMDILIPLLAWKTSIIKAVKKSTLLEKLTGPVYGPLNQLFSLMVKKTSHKYGLETKR